MKGKKDWFDGIDETVHAADCITFNNTHSVTGEMLYNIDEFFDGWKRDYVKKRMITLYGNNAKLIPNPSQ